MIPLHPLRSPHHSDLTQSKPTALPDLMDTPLQPTNIVDFATSHSDASRALARKRQSAFLPPGGIPTNAPLRRLRYELAGIDACQADVDFAAYVAGCLDPNELPNYESSLTPADREEARLLKKLLNDESIGSEDAHTGNKAAKALVAGTMEPKKLPENLTEFLDRCLTRAGT
jgi:hypothetical protein